MAAREMGVRGYVSAYDAETGEMAWRFYTVPGILQNRSRIRFWRRLRRHGPDEWWKYGGGERCGIRLCTIRNWICFLLEWAMADLESANSQPRTAATIYSLARLWLLRPETGEYVWHYQENPDEAWDYDSDGQMILADSDNRRKAAKSFAACAEEWDFLRAGSRDGGVDFRCAVHTYHVGQRRGHEDRPACGDGAGALCGTRLEVVIPGPLGAHSWQPMSYSPVTGLVYIPIQDVGFPYKSDADFHAKNLGFDVGIDFAAAGMPQDPAIKKAIMNSVRGRLVAWDPLQQKQAWDVDRPEAWNGGVVSTAGNLVFEGTAKGNFEAYRADNGSRVWSYAIQTGAIAGPI